MFIGLWQSREHSLYEVGQDKESGPHRVPKHAEPQQPLQVRGNNSHEKNNKNLGKEGIGMSGILK